MSAVRPIRGDVLPPREPDAEVVALLRKMLARAESGEVRGVCLVVDLEGERMTTAYVTNGNLFAISHGLSQLWWRFQQKCHEEADDG